MKINTFYTATSMRSGHITSKMINDMLVQVVKALGSDLLGITLGDVGTHSIRTSFAMLMYLNGAQDTSNIFESTLTNLVRARAVASLMRHTVISLPYFIA